MEGNQIPMIEEILSRGGKPIVATPPKPWFRVIGFDKDTTEEHVRALIELVATPKHVLIARDTHNAFAYAWVEMDTETDKAKACQALTTMGYRTLSP